MCIYITKSPVSVKNCLQRFKDTMFNLYNQVAIVTGGANGIGAEIIHEFLKEGVRYVAIVDIDEAKGTKLEKEMTAKYGEDKAKFFKCDVTKDEQLFSIFETVIKKFGAIDLVVNNAGIARDTMDMYKKEININFTATVTSTLKALEVMRADQGGKGGTVINTSSIVALSLLSPAVFVYGATKSAILHFSNCIGKDEYYRHTNVRVITMCFSCTDTDILPSMNSFDDIVNEGVKQFVGYFRQQGFMQTSATAAKGVVEAYKNGNSGSTWLVDNNKITNITDDLIEGYRSMSKQTTLASIYS